MKNNIREKIESKRQENREYNRAEEILFATLEEYGFDEFIIRGGAFSDTVIEAMLKFKED